MSMDETDYYRSTTTDQNRSHHQHDAVKMEILTTLEGLTVYIPSLGAGGTLTETSCDSNSPSLPPSLRVIVLKITPVPFFFFVITSFSTIARLTFLHIADQTDAISCKQLTLNVCVAAVMALHGIGCRTRLRRTSVPSIGIKLYRNIHIVVWLSLKFSS